MSSPPFPPDGAPSATLPPRGDLAAAKALHAALLALPGDAPVRIDAGGAETIGQAMAQVLLAARARHAAFVIHPLSQALGDQLRSLALAPLLSSPTEG